MNHCLTTLIWIASLGSRVLREQHFARKVKRPYVLIFNCNWNSIVSHGIWFQFVILVCRDCELILPSHVTFVNQSYKLCDQSHVENYSCTAGLHLCLDFIFSSLYSGHLYKLWENLWCGKPVLVVCVPETSG